MSKTYTVHPINESSFAIQEKTLLNQGLCYLLLGREKALLIDTGLGYKGLKETVRQLTDLPVLVANTHAHVDHIGGNHLFEEVWFHEKDQEIFKRHIDPKYTLNLLTEGMPGILRPIVKGIAKKLVQVDPSGNYQYFGDSMVFHLGGRDVEVIPTPGHTPGSVCFLDRQARLLFSGDTVCEWGILLHFKGECCPPAEYLASVERLMDLSGQFDSIWPGHHGFPVDKSYLEDYHTCAKQIVEGSAQHKTEQGRKCACFGRVIISVQEEP